MPCHFQLQLPPSDIEVLAGRYPDDDTDALEAGRRIKEGEYSRKNLERIFCWKANDRGKSRLLGNTDVEIEDALRLAVNAKTERAAIAVLCGLDGVGVPVASAIMTRVKPETFTVIDFRALESLGIKKYSMGIGLYLAYLRACRELSGQHRVPLRMLDRALWQWSSEKGTGQEKY